VIVIFREIFLSFETPDEMVIFGFCRLRISAAAGLDGAIPELTGAALVRELHVYGQMRKVGDRGGDAKAQHMGFGGKLMRRAEQIAGEHGFAKMAVIAGIGTRKYYAKLGYHLEGTYMVKRVNMLYRVKHLCRPCINDIQIAAAIVGLVTVVLSIPVVLGDLCILS